MRVIIAQKIKFLSKEYEYLQKQQIGILTHNFFSESQFVIGCDTTS
jgi:hypothetical protein